MKLSKMHHLLLMYGFSPLNKPRKDIFATISARKRIATVTSQINVKYFRNGYRSNVLGVFRHTEKSAIKAQSLSNRRTQSYKDN